MLSPMKFQIDFVIYAVRSDCLVLIIGRMKIGKGWRQQRIRNWWPSESNNNNNNDHPNSTCRIRLLTSVIIIRTIPIIPTYNIIIPDHYLSPPFFSFLSPRTVERTTPAKRKAQPGLRLTPAQGQQPWLTTKTWQLGSACCWPSTNVSSWGSSTVICKGSEIT